MSAVYNSTVQGFYLSYYGRPADPAGLTFWTGQLAAAGGNLSSILDAFGTSAEATRRYGTGTTESKIQAVYQQTFGRAADATGLAFYTTEITAGRITLIDMSKRIIDGATGDDVTIRTNRTSAAQSFTDKLVTDAQKAGYSGAAAEDTARSWITTVTKDAATVTAAVATADSTITSLLPQTFSLATTADKFTGSAGSDTVSGTLSGLTTTLNQTDVLDGGAGTDTLDVAWGANFAGFTLGTGSMKNIEIVNLTNSGTVARDFSGKGISGVTTYNIVGPTGTLSDLASTDTVFNLKSQATSGAATVTMTFDTEATTGSSTKLTVGVDGSGKAGTAGNGTSLTGEGALVIAANGVELQTLNATGTNIASLTGTGTTAVTVTGDGSLRLTALGSTTKTVDASALKGAFDVTVNESANGVSSVKGGAGDDHIRATTNALSLTASVDGGAGTNRLVLSGSATAVEYAMSNIPTIFVGSQTALTFSAAKATTEITSITASDSVGGALTFNSMGSADLALTSTQRSAGYNLTTSNSGKLTVAVNKTSTSTATNASTATNDDNFLNAKASEVTVNVQNGIKWSGDLTADAATAVTISNAGLLNDTVVKTGAAKSITINQSASDSATNTIVLNVLDTSTSSALETLNLTVVKNLGISSTGTQNNTLSSNKDQLASVKNLTIATDVSFGGGNGTDYDFEAANVITLSGTKDASAVLMDQVGRNVQTYGTTVTATGLKGGLTIDELYVGTDQAILVDVTGVLSTSSSKSAVSLGAATNGFKVGDTSTRSGSITVKANGMDANLTVGATEARDVTIEASGVLGTVNIGAITADNLSVDVSKTSTTVTESNATVRTSATYKGTPTAQNNVDFTLASNSTAFSGNVSGSLLVDTYTFTSTNTAQTSITLTGSLGSDADIVTVDGRVSTNSTGLVINLGGLTTESTDVITVRGALNVKNTITGTSGKDTIFGGTKADSIDLGSGTDTFILNNLTDTGAVDVTKVVVGSKITAGGSVATTGFDVVTGFGASDKIYTQGTIEGTARYSYADNFATSAGMVSGSYNASAGTFTFNTASATNLDTLYIFADSSSVLRGIVLVGFAGTFTADTSSSQTGFVGSTS